MTVLADVDTRSAVDRAICKTRIQEPYANLPYSLLNQAYRRPTCGGAFSCHVQPLGARPVDIASLRAARADASGCMARLRPRLVEVLVPSVDGDRQGGGVRDFARQQRYY